MKLKDLSGCSIQAAREELWPPLAAIHESGNKMDVDDFTISKELKLDGDEHALLHGLRSNLKSTKEIVKRYNESIQVESEIEEKDEIIDHEEENTPMIDKDQKTLF